MRKNICEQIKFIRKKVNLSQDRFGKKLGISGKSISAYETGKVEPPLKILEKISDAYEVTTTGINTNDLGKLENKIKTVQQSLNEIWEIIGTH